MTFERRALSLALALVALGPLSCRQQRSDAATAPSSVPSAPPAQVGADVAVAEIDGVVVMGSELEDRVRARLVRLQQEEYDIRKQGLDDLIGDRLIDAEAKRRGVTREALLKAEVEDKVQKPTSCRDRQGL